MANIISGSFIGIDQSSSTTPQKSYVRQFVDILQSDIKGDFSTRKKYEVFVTGGINQHPVRSSLFQTIFDQDFTLSTANPMLDITIGTYSEDITTSNAVTGETTINPQICGVDFSYDSAGKISGFQNNELMVREKVNIYRQYAQNLLGNADSYFTAPHGETLSATSTAKKINAALFINIKRLFTRDNIFKGSFGMKLYKNGSFLLSDTRNDNNELGENIVNLDADPDLYQGDNNELLTITDSLASTNLSISPVGGEVSTLLSNGEYVGLIYYDKGIIVLDMEKVFNGDQLLRGIINSNNTEAITESFGPWFHEIFDGADTGTGQYYKDLYYSSNPAEAEAAAQAADSNDTALSVSARNDLGLTTQQLQKLFNLSFGEGDDITFYVPAQGNADLTGLVLNEFPSGYPMFSFSSEYYTNAEVVENEPGYELFEGSLYPDFVLKASIDDILDHVCSTRFGNLQETSIIFRNETVINSRLIFCRAAPSQLNYSTNPTYTNSQGEIIALVDGNPFSYITTVGLYDSAGTLVAVAKTSRPIEKNKETDLSLRIRLDF